MIKTQANELIHEDSPYLQQHAHNPVDWYPWGDKAFQKAKKDNKLIFLSIGYSTCHWCHVMERESFENRDIADILNRYYISIKVDREEYPNIDKHYQEIYRMMNNRSGGWPLTVIMTPNAEVFFTATYIPAKERYGYKGLGQVLNEIHNLYINQKDKVLKSANSIKNATQKLLNSKHNSYDKLDKDIAKEFIYEVKQSYDSRYKGLGKQPKFPHATTWDTLLDIYRINQNKKAKDMVIQSLKAMTKGGINDQIEGGFYRYSTDEAWIIPHFEKMLYTNAELIESYANAYKITGENIFLDTIEQTIENINSRFKVDNLYYSASDADSDGVEGRYFLFTYDESYKALLDAGFDKSEAKKTLKYFNITEFGNFEEEQTNPYITKDNKPKELNKIKEILKSIRAKRNYPFIDKKIQTSWNSLYIHALFKANHSIDALKSLDTLLSKLYIKGELYHQMLLGKSPKVKAYLEDYAFLIDTLIDAYEVSLDKKYLNLANNLTQKAINKFYKNSKWMMSDDNFVSVADLYDASYRSAMAVMIQNMLKLSLLGDDFDIYQLAKNMLLSQAKRLNQTPSSYPYAIKVAISIQHPWIVLKSNKSNLEKNRDLISKIEYPYLLIKDENQSEYSACTMEKCFATHKDIQSVINDIKKEVFFR
ncbi:MAG TPA: thioredoxin domain-containing protein [Campylobacterales bacterium]|nr:thioredoxin domain-containing protein [Campylobacterales bacterium]